MLRRDLPLLLAATLSAPALAQTLPDRPIRWIVPYAAGGTGDIVTRTVAPAVAERLGRTIVVENRPGANGLPGTDIVARSPGDGTTVVLGVFGPITVMPHLVRMPYDPQKDLAPVSLMVSVPALVVVPPNHPAKSFQDLVAMARARPGELNNGAVGVGSSGQLAAGLLATMGGGRLTTVNYSGGAPAQVDLMAGRLDVMFDNAPAALPRVRAGQLRAIAITSLQRSPLLPDVPTVAELGFPGYEVSTWMGALVAGTTPPALIAILNRAIVDTLNDPAMKERLTSQMFDVRPTTPEQFAEYIRAETEKWGQVVRENDIRAQ
ncbi:MAG TPA: tripartite tricarboxylate transporter substrate binding protein [Falsiroseomonas sp.]|jgi:tripartite-type tricarboxylate transporter receptor subunit TctC|nr:tripartite tricarboxylate transporter substrate binding protein [Falsiroseomonas sp.]